MVSPPSDPGKAALPAPPSNRAATLGGAAPDAGQGSARAGAASAADRASIGPLDGPGALLILLAEVGAALESSLLEAGASSRGASPPAFTQAPQTPAQAARAMIERVLDFVPESSPAVEPWSASLPRIDAGVQAGIEQAVAIVGAWRDAPPAAAEAVAKAAALAAHALGDEPLSALWLAPEYAGLRPRLERLRRRRRALGRRALDPDYRPAVFDDTEPVA